MKKLIYFLTLILLLLISSCQKVIDIDVSDTEPKLVIEALYDAVGEKVSVKISKTVNVFDATDDFPMISGATVRIIDENEVTTTLSDEGNGHYLLDNYSPTYNSFYTLQVVLDGIIYESKDSLLAVVPLDSLRYEFQEGSLFFEEGNLVFFEFEDPTEDNFYRLKLTVNSEPLTKSRDQMLFVNGSSKNSKQSIPIYWKVFENKDTIQVDLLSYSQKSYFYYSDFFDVLSKSPVVAAPANPRAQWENDSGEDIDVLGHFTAFGYHRKSVVIEE